MKSPYAHFIIALAVFVASLVAYGFWYSAVSNESALVAQIQSKIDTNTATASRIASAQAALAEISGDEAQVQAYFVPQAGVVGFIDDLETRGHAFGAFVNVLSVSAVNAGSHPSLTLALTVKGTFDAVMRTVGSIEYSPYDLSIAGMSVGQDGKNVWHADVTLSVGSAPASAAATSTAAH